MRQRGFIATIFIIGCATGGVASKLVPLVVPPARAGTSPTRSEYLCSEVDPKTLGEQLNKAGAEGWELASVTPHSKTGSGGFTFLDAFVFCARRTLP